MGRQHQRVDWPWMEHHTMESWEPRRVEEVGCKICSGAPTVSQTTGQVKVKGERWPVTSFRKTSTLLELFHHWCLVSLNKSLVGGCSSILGPQVLVLWSCPSHLGTSWFEMRVHLASDSLRGPEYLSWYCVGLAILCDTVLWVQTSSEPLVEGIFPLELTWFLAPFPPNSFGWECKPRSSLCTHAFHHMDSKDPDIYVLDGWMLATKTHPACTIHKDRMWLLPWLD